MQSLLIKQINLTSSSNSEKNLNFIKNNVKSATKFEFNVSSMRDDEEECKEEAPYNQNELVEIFNKYYSQDKINLGRIIFAKRLPNNDEY